MSVYANMYVLIVDRRSDLVFSLQKLEHEVVGIGSRFRYNRYVLTMYLAGEQLNALILACTQSVACLHWITMANSTIAVLGNRSVNMIVEIFVDTE